MDIKEYSRGLHVEEAEPDELSKSIAKSAEEWIARSIAEASGLDFNDAPGGPRAPVSHELFDRVLKEHKFLLWFWKIMDTGGEDADVLIKMYEQETGETVPQYFLGEE